MTRHRGSDAAELSLLAVARLVDPLGVEHHQEVIVVAVLHRAQ